MPTRLVSGGPHYLSAERALGRAPSLLTAVIRTSCRPTGLTRQRKIKDLNVGVGTKFLDQQLTRCGSDRPVQDHKLGVQQSRPDTSLLVFGPQSNLTRTTGSMDSSMDERLLS